MSASYATKAQVMALTGLSDSAALETIVELTQAMLRADVWGDALSQGHLTLASHYAVVKLDPSQLGGPVASRTIDKISESYAVAPVSDADLASTSYGQMHIALRRNLAAKVPYGTGETLPDFSLPDGRIH